MSNRKEHIEKILEDVGLEWAEVKQNDYPAEAGYGKDAFDIIFRFTAKVVIPKDDSDGDIKVGIITILNKLTEGIEQKIKNVT